MVTTSGSHVLGATDLARLACTARAFGRPQLEWGERAAAEEAARLMVSTRADRARAPRQSGESSIAVLWALEWRSWLPIFES